MIEHFSKWVELVALPDKSSHNTSRAFLQQVLSRFGVCVGCFIDQGSKFKGEFQDLFDHVLIDTRNDDYKLKVKQFDVGDFVYF